MLEGFLGFSTGSLLGVVGGLATLVSIITQVLKNILPSSFPTKLLVIIISLVVTLGFVLLFYGVTIGMIIAGIGGSFVVSFISLYGWDTFNELVQRYKIKDKDGESDGK